MVKQVIAYRKLIMIAALACITVGVIYKLDIDDYTEALTKIGKRISSVPTFVILVGIFVFVISFFGCCGAIRESTCMLTTYAVIVIIFFIFQEALGIFVFLRPDGFGEKFKEDISREIKNAVNKYQSSKAARETVDALQYGIKCCGAKGPSDWPANNIPSSCCLDKPKNCGLISAFKEGCESKLFEFLESSLKVTGTLVIITGIAELAVAVLALCLANAIRHRDSESSEDED